MLHFIIFLKEVINFIWKDTKTVLTTLKQCYWIDIESVKITISIIYNFSFKKETQIFFRQKISDK